MRPIFVLLMALAIHTFGTQEAEARRGGSGYTEKLEFVMMTTAPGQNGEPLALCVLVRTQNVMFIDLWRTQKGYALAENRCDVERFIPVDADLLALLKRDAGVPSEVPEEPQVKTGLAVPIWAWAVLAGIVTLIGLKLRRKAARKAERQILMGEASPAAIAILDAMCHAAKADGNVSPSELVEIANAAQQMTGETIDPQRVVEMAKLAEENLTDQDYKRFVAGRSEEEKEVMMRGVLFVSVADGKLDNKEQHFVGKLAGVMKMPSERIHELLNEVVAARSTEAVA
jgi:tellurite resistance protein